MTGVKARISLPGKISNNQMKVLQEFCNEQFSKDARDHTRRILKIACVALNEKFGFGAERCGEFLSEVTKISDEHISDEVFWIHADKRLQQMGVPFEKEDYERMGL